jgi:peptidoglycan/LPS O-acetylase OafA/YrhL
VKLLTPLTASGVDLFFVLSGFLIGSILLDNREAANQFKVFYLRRFCRILPIYFVWIALFFVLGKLLLNDWLFASRYPAWSYPTFTQNFFMSNIGGFGAGWLAVTWSLAIEEQFYLTAPLLIR